MAESDQHEVTRLLERWRGGDRAALEQLTPLVYEELRRLAHSYMRREHQGHPLQTTALVHEAYLRLVGGDVQYQGRLHFFNAAALAMRRILVNHALQHRTVKRGGDRGRIDLEQLDVAQPTASEPMDWTVLDDALKKLEAASPRQHQVVMLRFFSGRTEAEIAQMLAVSESTVRRDWATARIWLCWAMQQKQ